jgi:signal transduction histidine kinase
MVPQRRAAAEEQASASFAKSAPSSRQKAIDTFAQSADIQTRVYEEAREKGDTLNARIVEPKAMAQQAPSGYGASGAITEDATTADAVTTEAAVAPANAVVAGGAAEQLKEKNLSGAAALRDEAQKDEASKDDAAKPAPSLKKSATPAKEPPSQFVVTSQLLSQIAAQGDAGLIPRFIGEKLVFLFWERQKDGRIAGCEVASEAFRDRIAGVLSSTWSPVRILTLLDENGSPLATPPDSGGRDWRRPFVAREISESLPRWEAAAYLTRPDSISAQARSSSLVIWIMVMILFVSVAGGGTMVLSSVYGEMRLAQQKATFVTNVSHELKTPLTSIGLFIDLLRRKRPLAPAKKEQYLSLMASETERLTRLINNVLDFSRDKAARRYSMRTIDAAEVAGQIVESQRVRLESRGFSLSSDIEAEGEGRGAVVRADPEALKQVILNLLSNAEKYSAEKKEIVVRVTAGPGWVLISVCDRGIGIPESEREKVFREFYRVDDSLSSGVQGTGLGLTIARRIARDHGGDITCAPRDGGGTEFIVRLPAVDAHAADGLADDGPAAEKEGTPS